MKKKKSSKSRGNSIGWLWLFTGILVGLFAAGLFYLKNNNHSERSAANVTTAKTASKKHPVKFDFYNVLQQPTKSTAATTAAATEVKPDKTTKTATTMTALPPPKTAQEGKIAKHAGKIAKNEVTIPKPNRITTTPAPKHYLLQVAAVKDFQQADQMKAELTLLGYSVSIQKDLQEGKTIWNRVMVGPYNSLQKAEAEQANLHKNHFKSIVVKD